MLLAGGVPGSLDTSSQPTSIQTPHRPGRLWIRPGWVKIIHTDASLHGRILAQLLLQFAQASADGLEIIGNPGHVFSPIWSFYIAIGAADFDFDRQRQGRHPGRQADHLGA